LIKNIAFAAFVLICGVFIWSEYKKSRKSHENIEILENRIDSLRGVRDTFWKIEYETRIKWKIRNEKDILYIYISNDSLQPIIRANLIDSIERRFGLSGR